MTTFANRKSSVWLHADSIGYGVGGTVAAWRGGTYALQASPFFYRGFVEYAGTDMAADPYCDAIPGLTCEDGLALLFRMGTYLPDVVILELGTNDLDPAINNRTPAQLAGFWSQELDGVWARRPHDKMQIVRLNLLKRYDAVDPKVIAANALLGGVVAGKAFKSQITTADQFNALTFPGDYFVAVHPNNAGYAKLSTLLSPTINAAVASSIPTVGA